MNSIDNYFRDKENTMSDETKPSEVSAEPSDTTPKVETFTADQVKRQIDSEISKAVNKYKETTYQKDLEMGIKRSLEEREKKSPEQIAMDELRRELEQERNLRIDKERKELVSKNEKSAIEKLAAAGFPIELAGFIANEDSEKTSNNLDVITKVLEDLVTNTKQKILGGNNTKVPGKTESKPPSNEPAENASKEEWKAWLKANR